MQVYFCLTFFAHYSYVARLLSTLQYPISSSSVYKYVQFHHSDPIISPFNKPSSKTYSRPLQLIMATIMNNGNNNNINGKKPVKFLEGDGFFYDRLLLKDNSIGNSSRIYYRSATDGVPFQWERSPGTPKHELQNEVIPPLIPPPAAQSKGLPPRPKNCVEQSKESGNKWKAWFWKKSKKKRDCNAIHRSVSCDIVSADKFEMEFMGSIHDSSSSASSSSSSWNRASLHSEVGLQRDTLDSRYFCSPWNITAILVRVARRV